MGTRDARARLGGLTGCFAAALMLFPGVASAVDRYAEPGGNGPDGAGGCLVSDPCGLEDAIEGTLAADVNDGDRVLLLAGTHNTAAAELTIIDAITVEPAPGAGRPIVNSTSATRAIFLFNGSDAATVRGIEILHSNSAGQGLSIGTNDLAERMVVTSNGQSACSASAAVLRDSVCVLAPASTGDGAMGTDTNGNVTQTSTLRNVTAISKAAGRPAIYLVASGGADLTMTARNVIASGSPDAYAETDGTASTSSAITLSSSAFMDFATLGTLATVTAPGTGDNTAATPQFVNFAANDFHQLPTSPTIDKGTIDPFLGTSDLDGAARIQGSAPDIGAYEAPAPVIQIPIATPEVPLGPNAKKCKAKKKKKQPKASAAAKKKKPKRCGRKPKKKQK